MSSFFSGLYSDPYPCGVSSSQTWLPDLSNKIRDFVEKGGSVYITADSQLIAQQLSNAAGAGIQFFTSSQVPVYQAAAGLSKMFLKDSLQEAAGQDDITIPFTPYKMGSGGPVLKEIGKAEALTTAEIILWQNGASSLMRYPVAVIAG